MRLRLAIAAALACTGFVTIAPTVGHALVELDITALPVDRYSMGAGSTMNARHRAAARSAI
jgi:hypothetical protein